MDFLAAQIRRAQQAGRIYAHVNADHAARGLLALTDGLAIHALLRSNTAETSLAIFDQHLERLFSPAG